VTEQIEKLLQLPTVVIKDVLTNFILDVAWRQIIGLNLED
jgi:transcriptional regulatory protein LevR